MQSAGEDFADVRCRCAPWFQGERQLELLRPDADSLFYRPQTRRALALAHSIEQRSHPWLSRALAPRRNPLNQQRARRMAAEGAVTQPKPSASDDPLFYAEARLVLHLAGAFRAGLRALYAEPIPAGAVVLDLISGGDRRFSSPIPPRQSVDPWADRRTAASSSPAKPGPGGAVRSLLLPPPSSRAIRLRRWWWKRIPDRPPCRAR